MASLAVLADEQASWRPSEFGYELWGCRVALAFPSVKLLDYRQQWSSLEESRNPFATVVMAHLKAQETRHDTAERQTWKLWLIRRLYQLGYDRQKIIGLYGFIDWVLQLPEPDASAFWHDFHEIEEEKGMPYVTSVERIGIEKGLQQGLQQGRQEGQAEMVLRVLSRRLGAVPSDLALRIRGLPDPQLLSLMDVVVTATTLPEVTAAVEALSASAGDEVHPDPSHRSYLPLRVAWVPGMAYFYWVEDVNIYGVATMHGPVSVDYTVPTAVTLSGIQASPAAGPALPLAGTLLALLAPLAGALAVRRRRA